MKMSLSKLKVAIVLLFFLTLVLYQFTHTVYLQGEIVPLSTPTSPTPTNTSPNQPGNKQESAKANLDCKGCHGVGSNLPYLGGAQFHTDVHRDYDIGHHSQAIKSGRKAATCLDCHTINGDMATILSKEDPKSTINRGNITATCGKCHQNQSLVEAGGLSNQPFIAYQESVHGKALALGNLKAAVCTDCHKSHDILPASKESSPIFKFNIAKTCGQCHATEAAEFVQSIHGTSLARGNSQSPSCTDCHGIHNIKPRVDSRQLLATNTCAGCHEGVRLNQEFGVASSRVSSYKDSYHGLAKQFGSNIVADCASCHGIHNILPSSNPKSLIHPANLVNTCGQCHPGAGSNFALGSVHLDPSATDIGSIGTKWVRWFYLTMIGLTIGGMAFHNVLVWRKKLIAKRKREHRTIVRLTRNQRIQHWLLLTSFITLVLSGFALLYPDTWLSWITGSDEHIRRIVHRVAAVVMLIVGVYHIGYLALTKEGRSWLKDMLPKLKDIRDFVQNMRHYLGDKVSRAKIDRFGYAEKAEYWAVIWGTVIMGVTGLLIWFKVEWFGFLPRWIVDIAIAIHYYEAILATAAIIVWHFYHVIFDPDVYPINLAFYDGRVSEELYKEEHELDYERLKQQEEEKALETETTTTESNNEEKQTNP
jgi:formate dehydrogenase gamma subunit